MQEFIDSTFLGLDIETTSLDPTDGQVISIAVSDGQATEVTDVRQADPTDWLRNLYTKTILAHNVDFDVPWLDYHYHTGIPEKIWDTMLAEQLLTAGLDLSTSLEATVERRLGKKLDKTQQTSFVGMDREELTDEQIEYAKLDAEILIPLAKAQAKAIANEGLTDVWDIEKRVKPVFLKMMQAGIGLDRTRLDPLIADARERMEALAQELEEELTPHVEWKRLERFEAEQYKLDEWLAAFEAEKERLKEEWSLPGFDPSSFGAEYADQTIDKKDGLPKGMKRWVKLKLKGWRAENPRPHKPNLVINPINLGSWQQVHAALCDLGLDLRDDKGKPTIGAKKIKAALADADPDLRSLLLKLLEYKNNAKLVQAFGDNLTQYLDEEGRIHATFKQLGTATGRPTCIAAGSYIDAPRDLLKRPKGIPIEDIEVGQYVYSFDENGVPRPRKVLEKIYQGVKPVRKLVWRASGNKSYLGEVKATPDHLFRLADGTYKRLDELKPGDKLSFLSRVIGSEGYARIGWGTEYRPDEHYHLIQPSTDCVSHHVNEHKLDNRMENLMEVTREEHQKIHREKRVYPTKPCPYSKQDLEALVRRGIKYAVGHSDHDFLTIKRWASDLEVTIPELRVKVCPVSPEQLADMLQEQAASRVAKHLGVTIKTVQRWARQYSIPVKDGRRKQETLPVNHRVVAVIDEGELLPTYDLTVEETPNFVVNEIVVHNCSRPNVLQMPNKAAFRACFRAKPGHVFIVADYSQMELRILAELSQDEVMVDAFKRELDLHRVTAAKQYYRHLPLEEAMAKVTVVNPENETRGKVNFSVVQ